MSFFHSLLSQSGERDLHDLTFWAAFENDDATPVANPYTTYSSHLMDVTQTANELSIASGILVKTGVGSVGSNIQKSQDAIIRARGLCIAFRVRYTGSGTVLLCGYGQTSATLAHAFLISSNGLTGRNASSDASSGITLTTNTWYHIFIVIRDGGAYWIINIGANYYLFNVSSLNTFTDLYRYSAIGSPGDIDWIREKQLAGAFTSSDWGLATFSITDAINGSTFTHNASGWIVFRLQTKVSSGTIELRFRIQDATNYLKLTIDSVSVGKLFSTVAGVDTQLGSNATMGQVSEYRIFLNAGSVRVFGDGTTALLISGTDSNFTGQSSGELTSQGTDGDITYIQCLPYELTDNGQLAELEVITAISEPP